MHINILKEARKHRKAKKFQSAIDVLTPIFNAGLENNEIDADIVRTLAQCFALAKNTSEGRKAFHASISKAPTDTLLIGRYAEYLAFAGDVPAGLNFIEKALEKAPHENNFALSKGIILHRDLKDLDAAATFLGEFIERHSKDHVDEFLARELRAVFHKIDKRPHNRASSNTNIWETLATRTAISKTNAISAGTSGGIKVASPLLKKDI